MEEDYKYYEDQIEHDEEEENSLLFNNEESEGNTYSNEPSNSNQEVLDLITERLKEKNDMKSTSISVDSNQSSSLSPQKNSINMDLEKDSSVDLNTLFEDNDKSAPSFTGASASQDQAFQDFKSYLNYHCYIRSYDIPYTHDLVNSSGDYDHYYISKLETWVRKMHAEGKISSYDEDELFKFLRRMK